MRRLLAVALLVPLLAGCAEPVFVPEAGPGAPGYRERPAPPPPAAEVVADAPAGPLPPGGAIDGVLREEGAFEVTGWARVDAEAPRGVLRLVLPTGVVAEVEEVETVPRPDVVAAVGSEELTWSGFSVRLRGALPEDRGVCVLSESEQGAFRLGGSDEGLCPA